MTVYINGLKVLTRRVSDEDLDRLEEEIRKHGFSIFELAKRGDDYEYTLNEEITREEALRIVEEMERGC